MSSKREISVSKLMVNPENYRFDPVDNQDEAIALMLEEKGDEIVNLARHIFHHGLDQAKYFRVRELKKDLYITLDGNRRLTALKCLANPSLAKDNSALKERFDKIIKEKGRVPDVVSCIVYHTEEEAAEWIKLDHTGKNSGVGQDPWGTQEKERFDWKFGGTPSPAMSLLTYYDDETKEKVDKKKIKISTVNRILSNPESRSYLGIDIRGGSVVLTTSKKEALDRVGKLFDKIIMDDVSVKEVYHTADTIRFMKKLFGDKPKVAAKAKAVSPKLRGKTKGAKRVVDLPPSTGRDTLIPQSCKLRITAPKINNIYHELKKTSLVDAPNAIGVLFRVFLEISLDYYFEKIAKQTFAQGTKLAGKVTRVADHLKARGAANDAQLQNIRRVPSKGNSILSIDNFHSYVHSFTTQPAPVDLITKWDNLQEFFEILWAQRPTRKKAKTR